MNEIWRQIENWVKGHVPEDKRVEFAPPADVAEVRSIESTLGIKLPSDVEESYLVHNGCKGVFENYTLLSLENMLLLWLGCKELIAIESDVSSTLAVKNQYWNELWIPIMDAGGDCVFVDLDPGETGVNGQIVKWKHESGTVRVIARSMRKFLFEFNGLLQTGGFEYDEEIEQVKRTHGIWLAE